jgi:hypothetical protein
MRSARQRRPHALGARALALQLCAWVLLGWCVRARGPSLAFAGAGGRGANASQCVVAVFLTVRDCVRVPPLEAFMARGLAAHPGAAALLEYFYVNYTAGNDTGRRSLAPPPRWIERVRARGRGLNRKSQEMTAMDFFALAFFLAERAAPWFFRGTDDTLLNLRRLPSYVAELGARCDPWRDAVVRGDCVVYNSSPVYLQGGAGFLCSRAAAARILAGIDLFLDMWTTAEDTTFGPFLDAIGIGVRSACSGAFMGHGPAKLRVKPAVDPRVRTIACPERNLNRTPVPWHLERVRDLFVYHKKDSVGKRLQNTLRHAELIFNAAPEFRWYTEDNFWPKACIIQRRA